MGGGGGKTAVRVPRLVSLLVRGGTAVHAGVDVLLLRLRTTL